MTPDISQMMKLSSIFIPLLFIIGFYCIIFSHNLVRALIGLEVITKAVTLLIILAGYATGHTALAQALVITMIVVEVVIVAVAAGLIVNIFRKYDSIDTRNLRSLIG